MTYFVAFLGILFVLGCLGSHARFILFLAQSCIEVSSQAPEATTDLDTFHLLLLLLALEPRTGRSGIDLVPMFEQILTLL